MNTSHQDFNAAKQIAFQVPAGTFRRARKADGNPSNFMGYKSNDGKKFYVLADSCFDIQEPECYINNHPAKQVYG
jgi:hypothetical protein